MPRPQWFVPCCFLLASPVTAADEGIPAKKLDELKAATVFVKVEGKEENATGSGFLIQVDGDTGLVATNRHVVFAGRKRFTPQKYSLVFWSGTGKEQAVPAEFVAADPDQDLAILRVKAKNLPAPLDLAPTVKPRETMTVYTLGFPLGERLSTTKGNPNVTISRGAVASLPQDPNGRLRRVQLDGELNPGNSGGPVVDADGKLVGIAVAKIEGTTISFAIPPAELTDMLKGRAAAVVIRSLSVDNGVAELQVEIPLIDPLGKLKTVELRHVRKNALRELPRADKVGAWPEIASGEKIVVNIADGKAVARISLKGLEKKSFDYFFQSAYTTAEGKRVATEPFSQKIDFGFSGLVHLGDPKASAWETITSAEGGFTVDMPMKPTLSKSSTRRSSGGTIKVFVLGCDTDNGSYLVYRIEMPTAAPKGAEQKILDAQRDVFAEQWNGKVMTEKRVLVQNYLGRDFTIKGKPDDKHVASIRVRQFIIGKSIFAVAVISGPDEELPEDSGRFLGSLALGDAKIRARGTPEPEAKGTELKGWGLAIDPDKDCKIIPGDKDISVEIPGTMHDLGGPLLKVNSPRVMREVDGDFVLTVKVSGDFKPGPKSTNPKSVPYAAGGILIWVDSGNFIRLERASMSRGKLFPHVAFLEQEGGYGGAAHNEAMKDGPFYLRMERKGSRILGAISVDGTSWKQLKPIDTVWPEKLKVGLAAVSTSSEPFSVKFEEFELKTGK